MGLVGWLAEKGQRGGERARGEAEADVQGHPGEQGGDDAKGVREDCAPWVSEREIACVCVCVCVCMKTREKKESNRDTA